MNSHDIFDRMAARAQEIAKLTAQLEELRREQDADVLATHQQGASIKDIVAIDGRSRQMIHRVIRDAR